MFTHSVVLHQVTSAAAVFTCSSRGRKMSCLLEKQTLGGVHRCFRNPCCLLLGNRCSVGSVMGGEEVVLPQKEVARINFTYNIHRNLVYRMPSAVCRFHGPWVTTSAGDDTIGASPSSAYRRNSASLSNKAKKLRGYDCREKETAVAHSRAAPPQPLRPPQACRACSAAVENGAAV